jgi:transcription elongation factor Elf1
MEDRMAAAQLESRFQCMECLARALLVEDETNDASKVYCNVCGQEFGTFAQVKAVVMERFAADATEDVRRAFRGLRPH